MFRDKQEDVQPLRELQWLAHYLKEHSRDDLATEIFKQIKVLRRKAQDSLQRAEADVIDLEDNRRKRSSDQAGNGTQG